MEFLRDPTFVRQLLLQEHRQREQALPPACLRSSRAPRNPEMSLGEYHCRPESKIRDTRSFQSKILLLDQIFSELFAAAMNRTSPRHGARKESHIGRRGSSISIILRLYIR